MKSHRTYFSSAVPLESLQVISGQDHGEDATFAPTVNRTFPVARLASGRGGTEIFLGEQLLSGHRALPFTVGRWAMQDRCQAAAAAWVETSDQRKHADYVMRNVSDSWYDNAATVAWI